MNVLVACEFSGVVRDAFRRQGHSAWSIDLQASPDNSPYHVQDDVLEHLDTGWDLIIAHPPCTYLTNSAAWAYKDGPYHQKLKPGTITGHQRRWAREQAINFVLRIANAEVKKIAIENPIGILSSRWRKPDQVIQPHQFGHDASKATCLWLKGLDPLVPTQLISPRMVNGRPRWANQTDSGQNRLSPGDNRWKLRSITYQGIADAMAEQWGG